MSNVELIFCGASDEANFIRLLLLFIVSIDVMFITDFSKGNVSGKLDISDHALSQAENWQNYKFLFSHTLHLCILSREFKNKTIKKLRVYFTITIKIG